MASILVADDSAVDQHLIGGLLASDPDLNVTFAAHGKDALEQMARALPDLVVTDLHMPEMDGFQLLSAVMNQYPLVPVILVTSQGSEEIAVQALEKGAASYVPKRMLARHLLDTVTRVLAVSDQRRSRAQLLEGMQRFDCEFELNSYGRLVTPLVTYLQDNLMHMGLCGETERIRIGVALQEALINAWYHGNLEVSSELREEDPKRFVELIEERRQIAPYCQRVVRVEARLCRAEATFVIRDEGPGFDVSMVPDPTAPGNLNKVGGRGLLLMRTFMNSVLFNDAGNQVTLIKRLAAP
jgi:CheY-like chemotaxis protein